MAMICVPIDVAANRPRAKVIGASACHAVSLAAELIAALVEVESVKGCACDPLCAIERGPISSANPIEIATNPMRAARFPIGNGGSIKIVGTLGDSSIAPAT